MNYEEKYKMALERAKYALTTDMDNSGHWAVNYIFPELKRTIEIDEMVDEFAHTEVKGYGIPSMIEVDAYRKDIEDVLEKQGEQKHADNVEPKFKVGDIVQYITDSTDRRKIEEIDTLCNMYHTDSSPIMFEIEDEWKVVVNAEDVEQESVDKVEPKFKVGDWVVLPLGIVAHIDSLNSTDYQVTTTDGKICDFKISKQDNYRLWSIADAKYGDVLACNEEILLFKSYSIQGCISLYCWYNGQTNNFHSKEVDETSLTTRNKIYPATKEQRELLFQKMEEAGYEWDCDKKELKKAGSKTFNG